jgi:hypothetical protein
VVELERLLCVIARKRQFFFFAILAHAPASVSVLGGGHFSACKKIPYGFPLHWCRLLGSDIFLSHGFSFFITWVELIFDSNYLFV